MKFLTIGSYKDAYYGLPLENQMNLRKRDVEYWVEMKTKMGDRISYYTIPGSGRGVTMGDFESMEEFALSQRFPTLRLGLVNGESYPLVEASLEVLKSLLEGLKKGPPSK